MTEHIHGNWWYKRVGKFHVYLHAKNQLHRSPLSWHIVKILQTYFRCLSMPRYDHHKRCYQLVQNFDVYLYAKNQIYPSTLFWNIGKILLTLYIGYLGHAWPCLQKRTVSTSRKFWCLSTCKKKSTWSLTSFLWYYTLKNPAIWLAEIILAHNLRIKILPDKGFAVKYKSQYDFYLKYFQEKLILQFFKKYQKDQFLTHFVHVKAK